MTTAGPNAGGPDASEKGKKPTEDEFENVSNPMPKNDDEEGLEEYND